MPKLINLTGKKFGRLIVILRMDNDKWGHHRWLCKCNCELGTEKIILGNDLKSGDTKSCGCLYREGNNIKHGHAVKGEETIAYKSWLGIKQRCTNPKNKSYKNYGDRGIIVCKRWLKFSNFLEDMGECPFGYTIERINNDKGYYKENCCWATRIQQNRNSRHNHLETHNGKTQCIIAWSEEFGIPPKTIQRRLKYGWMIEKALTTPIKKRRTNNGKRIPSKFDVLQTKE